MQLRDPSGSGTVAYGGIISGNASGDQQYVSNTDGWYFCEFSIPKASLGYDEAAGTVELTFDFEIASGVKVKNNGLVSASNSNADTLLTYALVEENSVEIEAVADVDVRVGGTVTATITVDGKAAFASAGIDVYYDNTKLDFTGIVGADRNEVEEKDFGLRIVDTGADKAAATHTYELTFTAIADTKTGEEGADVPTEITVYSAGFSTAANADENDLTPATILVKTATVSIGKELFDVTFPTGGWFVAGEEAVEDGSPYTITADAIRWANYDYGNVYYTIGNGEPQLVEFDENGAYTIPAVTGDVVISFENDEVPTGKEYDVTFDPNETAPVDKAGETANYAVDYWFVVPADKAKDQANQEDGYYYTVDVVIGTEPYTVTNKETVAEGVKYTIPGEVITGDINITITYVEDACEQVKVVFTGSGIDNATPNTDQNVTTGAAFNFTLTKDDAYEYTVSAVITDTDTPVVLVEGENGLYTIEAANNDTTITITKTLIITNPAITSEEYAGNMYLVTIDNAKREDGRVYKYDGNDMYWNAKYNAYCYLVTVDGEATLDTSLITLGAPAGELVEIAALVPDVNEETFYDINKTGVNDANDAQFAYNAYNGDYTEITAAVTMEKLLRADVGGDKKVDTTDVQAIVNFLLGN